MQHTATCQVDTKRQDQKKTSHCKKKLYCIEKKTVLYCNTRVTHCNTLQHNAIHNTLWYMRRIRRDRQPKTATHCNTPQHLGKALQRTATHCNALQHTATHYNTLQHRRRIRRDGQQKTAQETPGAALLFVARWLFWTWTWVVAHIWMIILHAWVTSHSWILSLWNVAPFGLECEWVISHIWMNHFTHMNK